MKRSPTFEATRTTLMVPIMSMEEVPVLSAADRDRLRASLDQAEADIAIGYGAEYNRSEMQGHFRSAMRREQRKRNGGVVTP